MLIAVHDGVRHYHHIMLVESGIESPRPTLHYSSEATAGCAPRRARWLVRGGGERTCEYASHGEYRTAASQLRRVGLGKPIRHLAPENCLFSAVRAPR